MSILSTFAFDTKRVSKEGLRRLNLLLGGILLAEGLAVLFLSNTTTSIRNISLGFLNQDYLASNGVGYKVLAPASHNWFTLNVGYVVAAFLLFSAGYCLLIATRRRKHYENDLDNSINALRWNTQVVSTGLMSLALALLAGVTDAVLLVTILATVAVFNLSAKRREERAEKSATSLYADKISLISGLLPLVVAVFYAVSTYVYGQSQGILFLLALIVLAIHFGLTHWAVSKPKFASKDYPRQERFYLLLTFLASTTLAGLIFFDTLK